MLKKYIIAILMALVALFIQGTVIKSLAPQSLIVPNLVLIMVVFWVFYELHVGAVFVAFVLGLIMDLGSGVLLGPWAGAFVVVTALLSLIAQRIFIDSPLAIAMAVFCSSIVASSVYLGLMAQFRTVAELNFTWFFWLIFEAAITAVVAPLIFVGLRLVYSVRSR